MALWFTNERTKLIEQALAFTGGDVESAAKRAGCPVAEAQAALDRMQRAIEARRGRPRKQAA